MSNNSIPESLHARKNALYSAYLALCDLETNSEIDKSLLKILKKERKRVRKEYQLADRCLDQYWVFYFMGDK